MYPFDSRLMWFISGHYSHLLRGLEKTPPQADSVLQARANTLRVWNRVRTGLMVLLYIGFAGTAIAIARRFIPELAAATPLLSALIGVVEGATGFLTALFLLLNRFLDQLEADILVILGTNAQKQAAN